MVQAATISAILGQRVRQWRIVRKFLETSGQIDDSTFGKWDSPLLEESNTLTNYDNAKIRRGLGAQLGFTGDFKSWADQGRRDQVSAASAVIADDIPRLSLNIKARSVAGVLSQLDAEMQRTGDSVKSNVVSVTTPTASANNSFSNSTLIFSSISRVRGSEDIITYEAWQGIASGTFEVVQTSFDGLNGLHRYEVRANRGILDDYDAQFSPRPVTFTVTATRETQETAATSTPSRTPANMVGNGTLTGSSTSVFAWTVSGTMFKWDTTTPLATSPNNNASSFLFSGGAGVVTTLRQAIPFQNASAVKFGIGDVTFCGFSYRASAISAGSVKFWFGFEDDAGAGQARIVSLTSTSNGTTWRTSGGFIHAPRDATAAVVRITASSDFVGRLWVGDICWSRVTPDLVTGLIVVPRRGHNQSRVGDLWEDGATANDEAGKIQTFLARNYGSVLAHSGSPTIADPA